MCDQFPFQRIHMHVVEFLDELRLTPHVEIVEARLPEMGQGIVGVPERKSELLGGGFFAWFGAQSPRHALFQDLHDAGRSALGRLADEQVNVVGHDDVTDDRQLVAVAHLAENFHKQIFSVR